MKKPTKMKVRSFVIKKENTDNEIIQKGNAFFYKDIIIYKSPFSLFGIKSVSLKQDFKAIEKHYEQKKKRR